MRLLLKIAMGVVLAAFAAMAGAYFYLPVNRISSELIMLGDLNNDNRWDVKDREALNAEGFETPYGFGS